MRDTDFTSMDEMNKSNMDLNTAMKDNWQEANEAQSYNLLDVSGRYSEKMITSERLYVNFCNNKLLLM